MKKLILFLCICINLTVYAQREKAEAYINTYKEVAIADMLRTGVPASITLAQGILESQYGESDLVKNSNNHFGIKCKTEWTGRKMYHDDDEKGECFRVYASAEESYKDHADFLKSRPHYAFLFKLDPTDFEGWSKGLKKAGYATNPAYPQKLLKLINEYNLQQYSLQALAMQKNNLLLENTTDDLVNTIQPAQKIFVANNQPPSKVKAIFPATPVVSTEGPVKKLPVYPQGIFSINNTKVIYGTEGTSLLSLANQHDIPLSKLLEYNDLPEMDILDTDRLIFIEKKQKKGSSEFHMMAAGETLHSISQQEGVRLDSILEYNNFKKGTPVTPGAKIFLRTVTTAATATKSSRSSK